jgi:TolB-like protein
MRLAPALFALALASLAPARARGDKPEQIPPPPGSVAVLDFESADPADAEQARAVGVLVATRMAQREGGLRVVGSDQVQAAVSYMREKVSLGLSDEQGRRDLAAVLGARYLLRGTLAHYGHRLVLTAVLLDAATAQTVGRFRVDTGEVEDLPLAADNLGDQIAVALGLPPVLDDAPFVTGHQMIGGPIAYLSVKIGQTIAGLKDFNVDTFTLRLDIEGDVVLKRWLLGYLEIGILIGRATKSDGSQAQGVFSLVPAGAGLKVLFRSDSALRPFIGAGIGLGFFTALIDSTKGVALRVDGVTGVVWMPWQRVGVIAELRADIDTQLTYGFSWNIGASFAF